LLQKIPTESAVLTQMTEHDWALVLEVFDATQSSRGEPGHNDRKFLEALHYFTVRNITWRALPAEFGNWNSVWKRFWRIALVVTFDGLPLGYEAFAGNVHDARTLQTIVTTMEVRHAMLGRADRRGDLSNNSRLPSFCE